jgi:hypothetical protein
MANIKLKDVLSLYSTPARTENPAIESRTTLKRIITTAGSPFPKIKTMGFLTDLALPEDDGDLHFFIETQDGANDPTAPMMVCEIQGIFKRGAGQPEDPRVQRFRQLFGRKVIVEALFRAWPEHLRDTRQPHLFEFHPVLSIGAIGEDPIDFSDRVVWPTGEDPDETARTFDAITTPPSGLTISVDNGRIVFHTPSKSMKRENYVHIEGHFRGGVKKVTSGAVFEFFETATGERSIQCFALKGSSAHDAITNLTPGRYEVGALCGLDLTALTAETPAWRTQLSPVLEFKKLKP